MAAKTTVTQAMRALRALDLPFTLHPYKYEDKGGSRVAALALGMPEERVVKTLVFETDAKVPVLILLPGTQELSTKNMARFLETKSLAPVQPQRAEQLTGYKVGGISPFGTKKTMPTYITEHILQYETIYINAGHRGLMLELSPTQMKEALNATLCPENIAISKG